MTQADFKRIGTEKMTNEIKEIWTHKCPDIDDIAAISILMEKGEKRFPEIQAATIKLVDPSEVKEDYKTLLERGVLCVGFGGGMFDEHPEDFDDGERIQNECAASLVARVLGVRNVPGVKEVVDYALNADHNADSAPGGIGILTKFGYRYLVPLAKTPELVEQEMENVFMASFTLLRAWIKQGESFLQCAKDYEQCKKKWAKDRDGKSFLISFVQSSNPDMQKYARSKDGGFAAVVVQISNSGNVQIYFDHRKVSKDLGARIVRRLRIEERSINGCKGHLNDSVLMQDGVIDGAPEWYYEYDKYLILNGSLTHSRPPTKISFDKIIELVMWAVNDYFNRWA